MNNILGCVRLLVIRDGVPQPVLPVPLRAGTAVHLLLFGTGFCFIVTFHLLFSATTG